MSSAPVTIDTDPPRTMASALADSLRGDIIKGVHAPGAKLAIKELCQRYDAGAIPMREALSRLATSGLVVAQDQRGFRVADVSRADAPAVVIGSREISPAGQVPVKFEIRFDDSAIRPNMTYALQARITVDGELWFINDTHHRVDPLAGEGQTILVKRVVRESDGPLHDTDWNLTFIEGFGGLPERAATLTIGNDGRAHGKGPCNGYFGGVKIDGDKISIGQVGATQMACEPKLMQAEHAYFQSLGKVAGYKLDGDTLTLSDADGRELLRFSR